MKHTINVTENALRKLRESSGINRNTAVELAERAYKNGIEYNETKGSLHRYLSSVTSNSKKGTIIKVYGNRVFVFNKRYNNDKSNEDKVISLVTVLYVPSNISKQAKNIMYRRKSKNGMS